MTYENGRHGRHLLGYFSLQSTFWWIASAVDVWLSLRFQLDQTNCDSDERLYIAVDLIDRSEVPYAKAVCPKSLHVEYTDEDGFTTTVEIDVVSLSTGQNSLGLHVLVVYINGDEQSNVFLWPYYGASLAVYAPNHEFIVIRGPDFVILFSANCAVEIELYPHFSHHVSRQ